MSTLTFTVTEEKAEQLANAASELGVSVEDLLRQITENFLTSQEDFQTAAEYVLKKIRNSTAGWRNEIPVESLVGWVEACAARQGPPIPRT
jgi:predicted DNA-binding protein